MSSTPSTGAQTGINSSLLVDSSTDEDDKNEQEDDNGASMVAGDGECEIVYKDNFNSKKLLMVMVYGIIVEDKNIGDCEAEPYASASGKKQFLPILLGLKDEVIRRSTSKKKPLPKCKNWNKPKLLAWLGDNPIENLVDVAFLIKEEASLRNVLIEAKKETSQLASNDNIKKSPWVTNLPFLRLYHCLLDDNVKKAFMIKDDAWNRQQLDARMSSNRPPSYEELVTKLFNNPNFKPDSMELFDLHHDFCDEMSLSLDIMPGLITPEEVKSRMADSRAKLVIVSLYFHCCACLFYYSNTICFQIKQIVNKWELSGNGFGQRTEDDDEFGHLDADNFMAGDNRQSFLQGYRSHILYLWHLADTNDILKKTLCVLDSLVTATSESVPLTEGANRKRKGNIDGETQFRDKVGAAMASLGYASVLNELGRAQTKLLDSRMSLIRATKEEEKELIEVAIEYASVAVEKLERKIQELERVKN
jgi:hypothetical protein